MYTAIRGRESPDFPLTERARLSHQEEFPDQPDSAIGRAVLHAANDTTTDCSDRVYRFFEMQVTRALH